MKNYDGWGEGGLKMLRMSRIEKIIMDGRVGAKADVLKLVRISRIDDEVPIDDEIDEEISSELNWR